MDARLPEFLKPLSVALVLLAVAGHAQAGEVPASPFRGVKVPGGVVAGDADATGLELNPGQLGILRAGSGAFLVDYWGNDVRRPGRGGALMLGGPLVGGLALGAGFQWLRPSLPGWPDDYQKVQLGAAMRLGRAAGLGFTWDHLWSAGYAGANSFSIGLGMQLHPMLAMGFVVRDVNRPSLVAGSPDLPREFDLEGTLRPLGNDWLEVSGGVRLLQGHDFAALPRVRVLGRLARGISLFGEIDWPRVRTNQTQPDGSVVPSDYLATAGIVIDGGRSATTLAGFGNWESGQQSGGGFNPGGSFMVRVRPERRAPLLPSPYVARVELEGLESDRQFLSQVIELRQLGDDPDVAAVLLEISGLHLGLGRIEELRDVIAEIRRSKPVFAHVTEPSTREYYLASACERIFIDPAGGLYLGGLAQTVTFYKSALDRLGVKVDLVRIAEFKGAMEPFVLNEQSTPVRENRNSLLDDNYGRLLADVVESRRREGMDEQRLRKAIDKSMFSALDAREAGLIDGVADDEDIKVALKELGQPGPVSDANTDRRDPGRWRPSRVAVILVDGELVEGDGDDVPFATREMAWSKRVTDAIQRAADDPSVRAVVLRVNSPGGSAVASDQIARALVRLGKTGKPIITSMGDVAASGGYYVAAPTATIFAEPATITGSIGIFGFKVDVGGLLGHLSIASETFKRGPHADLYSPFRPWTEEERALMLERLRSMYRRFLDTVAAGRGDRGITAERADELGRGRVWTGAQAKANGLVDQIGGVTSALEEAARRGGVPLGPGGLPEVVVLPKPLSGLFGLAKLPGGRQVEKLLLPLIVGGASGVMARLPYDIETQ